MLEVLTEKKDALDLLFTKWSPKSSTEMVGLDECLDRVLAEDVYAQYNIPVVRSSSMDGIAVSSAMFVNPQTGEEVMPDTEHWVLGKDYVRADTGDDFDDAFDAVIPIEMVTLLENGGVKLDFSASGMPGPKKTEPFRVVPGSFVKPAGSSVKEGTLLAAKGTKVRPEDIASMGMGGGKQFAVVKKPVVAFIPTGSELVPAGSALQRGQNFNSNGPMVKAMLKQLGAEPVIMEIVKDKKSELRSALEEALNTADIVVINGGSSKGEEDFNTRLLDEMGELLVHGVSAVPGRPTGMAVIGGKPVINTSGPAEACFYGMTWCVAELINAILGLKERKAAKRMVTLAEDLTTPPVMSALIRLQVEETPEGPVAYPLDRFKSDMPSMMRTNALFMSHIGTGLYPAGTQIEVEMRL